MRKRKKRDTIRETIYPDGMVASDRKVRVTLGRLRLWELAEVCEQFQLIGEATANAASGSIDAWSLRLIKQVTREARKKRLRKLFTAIVRAAQRDEKGVAAARLTASRALELIVLFTKFDFITSEQVAATVRDLLNAKTGKSTRNYRASLRALGGSPSSPPTEETAEQE